jgi:hypothetical protein
MKKFLLVYLTLVVLNLNAQPLFYEPFSYTPSNVNGLFVQSNAVWKNANTGDSIFVVANSLSYPGLAASQGEKVAFDGAGVDNYRAFTQQTSGEVYASFVMNVASLGLMNTTGTYVLTLLENNSTSAFGACLWLKKSATAGKFNIGISNRSNSAVSYLPADLDTLTSHFIVLSYEIIAGSANDVSSIWLNTAQFGGSEPASSASALGGTDLSVAGIGRLMLRQPATTANAPFVQFDEIRVGTTWNDVTPCAAPTTYYQDLDGDSFGNPNAAIQACMPMAGLVLNNQDCNDNNAAINPNTVWYADADGDGFGNVAVTQTACVQPNGFVTNNTDCNDNNALANVVTTWYADTDGDGYGNAATSMQNCGQPAGYVANSTDCNDASAAVNPGAVEIFNGIDDNCNNTVDEGFTPINYYLDNDGDGVGGNTFVLGITSPGPNYVLITGDCNDNSAVMYPGNTETCDNLDNDCDASIDEGLIFLTYFQDSDGDTYGNLSVTLSACSAPQGYVLNSTDCNDQNSAINPGAQDIPGNGIDEDCSGLDAPIVAAQLGLYEFTQASGCPVLANTVTTQPANASFSIYTNVGGTCTAAANVFNNNTWNTTGTINLNNYNEFSVQADSCFGLSLTKLAFTHKVSNVNTIPTWHLRSSVDNFANDIASDSITTNVILNDTVTLGAAFANLNQVTFRFYITGISTAGATWRNDNVSLWGFINSVQPQTFYADTDGDGFGDAANTLLSCTLPAGYSTNNTDCDDSNAQINPNTIWYLDTDQDGYGDPNNFTTSCLTPPGTVLNGDDCDDTNNQLNLVDMYYVDADGDGFGDEATGVETCAQPANTVTVGGDCDDANDQIYPGATEICDDLDNNCDGNTDEGLPSITYYEDLDFDGFGSNVSLVSCDSLGAGYALTTGDCDDDNDQVYPGATEVLDNGIDENCDGFDNYAGLTDLSVLYVSLIPNPSEGDVTITVSTNEQFELTICDVTGKLVLSLKNIVNGTSVSTRSWAPGTYFVTLRQNQQQIVSKLMVK